MRIVLAHDWLVGYRGGEAVLDRIARVLIEDGHEIAALYTMFDDGRPLAPTVDGLRKVVSPLNRISRGVGGGGLRRWMLPLYPWAVEWLSKRLERERGVDLVVSTSSAAMKGLRAPVNGGAKHVCYCHSPARYVWGEDAEYGALRGEGLKGLLRAGGLRAVGKSFKAWDFRTAQKPADGGSVDRFLANSTHTARMIRECFGRDATVLFPPVRVGWFAECSRGDRTRERGEAQPRDVRGIAGKAKPAHEGGAGEYWLLAGALEPYKRADLAIAAAAKAGTRLVVAGDGTQRRALGRVAETHRANVEFLGRVSDDRLRDLYTQARLLVFPQVEDFGMTAVEAQACGTPVVARRAGGALDTVIDGSTGAFFDEPTPEAIVRAAQRCPARGDACRENAARFSEAAFDEGLRRAVR